MIIRRLWNLSRLGQEILAKLGLDSSKATLKFIDKLGCIVRNVGDELDHIDANFRAAAKTCSEV
ncbi:hypothetical protein OH492_26510 [Vibrio chagasii]|nr:hypothetical protein [Vibrio chagasii]